MKIQNPRNPVFPKAFKLGLVLATAACVTVNVNFPESAVQKATDDYVRELYRAKEKGKGTQPEPSTPKSETQSLNLLSISAAHAEEAPAFKVNSEKSRQIRDRLASRLDDVLAQKRTGVLGETKDGMLELREPEKLKAKKLLLKKLEKIVSDENADRKELYEDTLKSNGMQPNRLKDIQRSFARSFQAESPSGTWVQDSEGSWARKP